MYKNFDEMPIMLSVNQAAEVLGISNVSLYKLIEKDKSFPVVQLGRRKSIPKEQLKEHFAKEKTEDGKVGLTSEKMKTARQNEKVLPQKPNPNVKKN